MGPWAHGPRGLILVGATVRWALGPSPRGWGWDPRGWAGPAQALARACFTYEIR